MLLMRRRAMRELGGVPALVRAPRMRGDARAVLQHFQHRGGETHRHLRAVLQSSAAGGMEMGYQLLDALFASESASRTCTRRGGSTSLHHRHRFDHDLGAREFAM